MSGLTKQQAAALSFIADYQAKKGHSPSYAEIGAALGLSPSSRSRIYKVVTALEERGAIRRLPYRARSIEVVQDNAKTHLRALLDAIKTGDANKVAWVAAVAEFDLSRRVAA